MKRAAWLRKTCRMVCHFLHQRTPKQVRALSTDSRTVPPQEEYTEEQYKALKKKIDRYLLPLMWLCYGIQQTDKTSIGTQATFGLREVQHPPACCARAVKKLTVFLCRIPDFLGSNVSLILPSPPVRIEADQIYRLMADHGFLHYLYGFRVPFQCNTTAVQDGTHPILLHDLLGGCSSLHRVLPELHPSHCASGSSGSFRGVCP